MSTGEKGNRLGEALRFAVTGGICFLIEFAALVGLRDGLGLDTLSETTDALERDTVVYPQFVRERCIGCGRCSVSCADGGHQAISLDENRRPVLDGKRCVGCHLCILVCPQRAIIPGKKRVPR